MVGPRKVFSWFLVGLVVVSSPNHGGKRFERTLGSKGIEGGELCLMRNAFLWHKL